MKNYKYLLDVDTGKVVEETAGNNEVVNTRQIFCLFVFFIETNKGKSADINGYIVCLRHVFIALKY